MLVNLNILSRSADQDGNPLTIVKIPVPDLNPDVYKLDSSSDDIKTKRFSKWVLKKYKQFKSGDIAYFLPASSYLNFLVTNEVVLIPKYWTAGLPESTRLKDDGIKKIFETYFPGKKIIQINPLALNLNGGGIHCWTQQIPK